MITKKQATCKHQWDINTKRCKVCKIAEELWEEVTDTRAVKFFRNKNEK